jgi:SAM-dependent methyltransferase
MYSRAWFETFASAVPSWITAAEVDAIARLAPTGAYPSLLDVGCGTGRVAAPLAEKGYRVTGIDTNVEALETARRAAPFVRYVALDQRHVGLLRWTFDAAVVLWNSFGFGSEADDLEVLRGLACVLRPEGRALFDLYHPEWLRRNEQTAVSDDRGAVIDRWLNTRRSCHEIRYANGSVDRIEFNVYSPDEIQSLLRAAGFGIDELLVWWKPAVPGPDSARYQVVSSRLHS